MIQGPEPLFINDGYFKYIAFEDPDWDFRTFDVDADTRKIDERLGSIINNTQTDLSAFKESGGKLILYQDWNETWVPPRTAVTYYNDVIKTMGGEDKTKDFFRLFMIPDYGMCAAMYPVTVKKTRPVCAYPEVAIYKGSGDTNDAENFKCGKPTW
jgi:feruloyl esterase